MPTSPVLPSRSPRRAFLKGAVCTAGAAASVALAPRFAFASPSDPNRGDAVVVVFLRGGADGLSMAPPSGAAFDSYRSIRPTIALTPDQTLPLDDSNPNAAFPQGMSGVVGLHPALQPLHDTVWATGQMAVIPAVGLPDGESRTRSHFEAQNFWDRGSASGSVTSGWLARTISAQPASGPVSGVNMSSNSSELFRGATAAFSIDNLNNFGINGFRDRGRATSALQSMYTGSGLINQTGRSTVSVTGMLDALSTEGGVPYPSGGFGRDLEQVAVMLKANIGLVTANIDLGGWDHHGELGSPGDPAGRFHRKAQELAAGLAAFITDLGPEGLAETTIVVISEFGRTIDENSSAGTDHGRGGTMFVIGGGVQGGVFGNDYPTVIEDSNANRRALPVLTDFRQPLTEVLASRVGVANVYPTFTPGTGLGVARTA